MSKRHRDRMSWSDEAGNVYVDEKWRKVPATLGSIPARDRLLDVHDDRDHHLASVLASGDLAPVVITAGPNGPALTWVLLEDGLIYILQVRHDDQMLPFGVGEPINSGDIWCRACGSKFALTAAALRTAALERPGRRIPRLHVSPVV